MMDGSAYEEECGGKLVHSLLTGFETGFDCMRIYGLLVPTRVIQIRAGQSSVYEMSAKIFLQNDFN